MAYISLSKIKKDQIEPSNTGYISLSKLKNEQLSEEELPQKSGYIPLSKQSVQPKQVNTQSGYLPPQDTILEAEEPKKSFGQKYQDTVNKIGNKLFDPIVDIIKPKKSFEIKVGEGLSPEQLVEAKNVLNTPAFGNKTITVTENILEANPNLKKKWCKSREK